jgi:tetratricopeptide (TPR) repeat protein
MRKNRPLVLMLLLLPFILPACSGIAVHKTPVASSPAEEESATAESESDELSSEPAADAEAEEEARLPKVDLSGELLYQILGSEMALQRQLFGAGVDGYMKLAQETRDPRFAERAAQAALFAHEDAKALLAARLWVELAPDHRPAHQMLIVAAIRTGSLDEALNQLDVLLAPTEGPPENRFDLIASLLTREHDVREAADLMKRYVSMHRDNADACFSAAELALRAGDYPGARDMIDRALELRPDWYGAIALKVRVLLMSNGADAAVSYLGDAVERFPGDTALRMTYARTLADLRRYDQALAQYESLSKTVRPNTEILLTMGLLNLQIDHVDAAEKLLLQVKKTGEHADDLPFYMGWIEEKRNRIPQAMADYAKVPKNTQNYFESRVRIAILTANQGDVAGARTQLSDLREQQPGQRKRLYEVEGELLRQAKMYQEGVDVLTAALNQFPRDAELLYYRALISESLGRIDLLERDLRAILDAQPDHVDALNALGYTLADRTDRYKEAYDYIKHALDLSPDNNAILDSMGWVLYRLGNYDEAVKYLRRSLDIKKDQEVAAHLGEVLWVMGQKDEAVAVWKDALAEFPKDNEAVRETMKRFGL